MKRSRTPKTGKKLPTVLAYDIGGTKVAVAVVDGRGRVLEELRVPVRLEEGKAAVLKEFGDLGAELLRRHPGCRRVGVGSAGPLDPRRGVLLDPTNFKTSAGTWGKVPLASILSRRLKRPVFVDNDAAAAVLAEHRIGAGKGFDNVMVLTLGTGLGTGVICNGELVRAGRGLHPEGGHLILKADDRTALCGCGNLGCAEAYLSGGGFSRRARAALGEPLVTAKELCERARAGNSAALALFDEYATMLAIAIHNYVVIYAPEIVVLTGSFAHAADLFLTQARMRLEKLLVRRREGVDMMPRLAVSPLENRAGIVGAAFVAFVHR